MITHVTRSMLLRRALQANGAFSALSGIALVVAAGPVAKLLGLDAPAILTALGACLLVYATALFLNAVRATPNLLEAWIAVILDLGWVAGSGVLILAGLLTPAGNWMVAMVADVVLLFAVLQLCGIRKLQRQRVATPQQG